MSGQNAVDLEVEYLFYSRAPLADWSRKPLPIPARIAHGRPNGAGLPGPESRCGLLLSKQRLDLRCVPYNPRHSRSRSHT